MRKQTILSWVMFIAGVFVFFQSCGELPTHYLSPSHGEDPISFIQGSLQLPEGVSAEVYDELLVSGATQSAFQSDGSFQVGIFRDMALPMVFVETRDGRIVTAVYVQPDTGKIVINDTTTALFLTFTALKLLGFRPNEHTAAELQQRTHFQELVGFIHNVMRNDLFHLFDYDTHPLIMEKSVDVAREYINSMQACSPGGSENTPNSAYIVCENNEIHIKNPKAIPYGISYYDMDLPANRENSYYLLKNYKFHFFSGQPLWIPENGILDVIFGEPSVKFSISDGNYLFCLSKMYFQVTEYASLLDFYLNGSDYIHVIGVDAAQKGSIGTGLTILNLILGSFIPIGFIKTVIEDVLNSDHIYDLCLDLMEEIGNTLIDEELHAEGFWGAAVYFFIHKWDKARKILAKFYRIIYKDYSDESIEGLLKQTNKYLKAIDNLLNIVQAVRFSYDLNTADNRVYYKIYKNGYTLQCVQSIPPGPPVVEVMPSRNFYPVGNEIKFRVYSYDPQQERVKYYFLKFYWLDYESTDYLTSGKMYTFTYTPTGERNYHFQFYAQNEDGAMSPPTHIFIKAINSYDIFAEDFSQYPKGLFNSNSIWTVEYQQPSEVRIVSDFAETPGSAKFVDYDPAIGYQFGYYAYMYTHVDGNPDTVTFYMKVEHPDDDFGVRAWPTMDGLSLPSYYVVIMDGWLHYVNLGIDLNNPQDYVPAYQVQAGQWYRVTLVVDWSNQEYDLYVDDHLIKHGIKFISTNWGFPISSSPYFQAVAFIDGKCRGGYIDDIRMSGGTLRGVHRVREPISVPAVVQRTIHGINGIN